MYLMDKLKEKFETEDNEVDPKNLNYKVGNTSGLDVTQQIPSDLAERVGHAAQRGGGEMEIKVENPTSFFIDREALLDTIQNLGLDVSFHSDPNVGYTSAYRTGQGRGFNVTHEYFTNYLEAIASFKKEKEARKEFNFNIGRINPHISTDEIPALQERMAQDVSLDPFGFASSDFSDQMRQMRDEAGKNMFRNKKFLSKLYYTLFLREARFPFEFYSTFAGYSDDFDRVWKHARHQACWELIQEEVDNKLNTFEAMKAKLQATRTIQMSDRGVEDSWIDAIEENDNLAETLEIPPGEKEIEQELEKRGIEEDLENLDEEVQQEIRQSAENQKIQTLSELKDYGGLDFKELRGVNRALREINNVQEVVVAGDVRFAVGGALNRLLNSLWKPPSKEEVDDPDITVEAKLSGLQQHLEIQQLRILEKAYVIGKNKNYKVNGKTVGVEKAAELVFRGYEAMFVDRPEKDAEDLHLDLLKRLFGRQNFERLLRMESIIFYNILPVWMLESEEQFENKDGDVVHEGWNAPRFIWKTIVERTWSEDDLEFWDFDFKNNWEGYFRELERNEEFKRDVAAASAAIYVWGHFTQITSKFEIDPNQYIEHEKGEYTWIEWMNKQGIGVNMEAMNGGPQTEFKLWRPKDMVSTCRAINITARKQFEEINQELYGCPVKFTIDMEHTASFGVDPWKEIEILREQEEWLAKNNEWGVPIDKDKPLAEMVRMYHLTKPGHETSQGTGHLHGPFRWGDTQLYTWLHDLVKYGFAQSDERASVMYEIGGEMSGTVQKAKLSMNMIELGIEPKGLDPSRVDPSGEPQSKEEALIARFFGINRSKFNREWAKIEEHAFDPLEDLMEAEPPGQDYTSRTMLEEGETRADQLDENRYI